MFLIIMKAHTIKMKERVANWDGSQIFGTWKNQW